MTDHFLFFGPGPFTLAMDPQFINLPKDGTILRKSKTDIIFSGTQVNFDKSMQPYKTWQYGQSSTDLFRLK